MARVFTGFVGVGPKGGGYEETAYTYEGRRSKKTRFVAVAELYLLGANTFDKVIPMFTPTSAHVHKDALICELNALGCRNVIPMDTVSEEMDPGAQWSWFERLLHVIQPGDSLVLDLTHGFRAVSIVLSAALGFLQRAKKVRLEHVLYGNHEKGGMIVDMKEFYVINDWAEAVSRLTEDADAGKLAELSHAGSLGALRELSDPELVSAFRAMTDCIRNVDVNNISTRVHDALSKVEHHQQHAGGSSRLLLQLVVEKFAALAWDHPPSGTYDFPYYSTQLKIIETLIEHRLLMQAYTAMRECVGSIGMSLVRKPKYRNMKEGRHWSYSRKHANEFVNMLQFGEKYRAGNEETQRIYGRLKDGFERLKADGIEPVLASFVRNIIEVRNGFDHAWLTGRSAPEGLDRRAEEYLEKLGKVIGEMEGKGYFGGMEEN